MTSEANQLQDTHGYKVHLSLVAITERMTYI